MPKKTKIFISLFFISIFSLLFQTSSAKYVIEDIYVVAKLDIDRCKPHIELIDISSSNTTHSTYANKTHIISGHLKITEKNIIKNSLSKDTIKILVANQPITPEFKSFSLISENATEKIYEFSFTNTIGDGPLSIFIPKGIIEDKSSLINDSQTFSTSIVIDNTPPTATFQEISIDNGKSKAEITVNEAISPLTGWNLSEDSKILTKEFTNYISYLLPITDFAQNSSSVLVDIQHATNILLEYDTFDDCSKQTLVSGGKVSAPTTISSDSICKTETMFVRLTGEIDSDMLQGKCYLYTHWGDGARGSCRYSEASYYHGYNPSSASEWFTVNKNNLCMYKKLVCTQFGGYRFKYSQYYLC